MATDTRETTPQPPRNLARRMAALIRLAERIGPEHRRRAEFEAVWQRMMLFNRMLFRLGVAPAQGPLTSEVLRQAKRECMDCGDWQRCRDWLDHKTPADAAAAFCTNHDVFAVLPHAPAPVGGGRPMNPAAEPER